VLRSPVETATQSGHRLVRGFFVGESICLAGSGQWLRVNITGSNVYWVLLEYKLNDVSANDKVGVFLMQKILIAVVLAVFSISANAIPVTWTLDNVIMETFVAGPSYTGVLTGSFDYDSVTNQYSNIDIFSTWSTDFHKFYFETAPPWNISVGSDTGLQIWNVNPEYNYIDIHLDFSSAITGQGGTVNLLNSTYMISSNSFAQSDASLISAGTISAVPVPAAAWLFGSALAGLGWMRRRKAV
jgi:hypothetical protein